MTRHRRGMTLLETLMVVMIVLLISIIALPTLYYAISHRQLNEAARVVQGALVAARDAAIRKNQPVGIRLVPDPAFPLAMLPNGKVDPTGILAMNQIIPLEIPPPYVNGVINTFPPQVYTYVPNIPNGSSVLIVEESVSVAGLPTEPTSWAYNVRVGDKIILGKGVIKKPYTVVGPVAVPNADQFITYGTMQPVRGNYMVPGEYLYVVNGVDDNSDGFIDNGWDGVTTNFEPEGWISPLESNGNYVIHRRAAPSLNMRSTVLPSNVVIDFTTGWSGQSRERSRVPGVAINPYDGTVDIVINPDGTVMPTSIYSAPTAVGIDGAMYHFWLAERGDVTSPNPAALAAPYLPVGALAPPPPAPPKAAPHAPVSYFGPALRGEYWLLTLFARSGNFTQVSNPIFDNPAAPAATYTGQPNPLYNTTMPYMASQQGASSY